MINKVELKALIKEAIAEYENEKKKNKHEKEHDIKTDFIEKIYHELGYKEAKNIAKQLDIELPYWMEWREKSR